jgi:hypothetical protein
MRRRPAGAIPTLGPLAVGARRDSGQYLAIGVRAAVSDHLGRATTRVELNAVRRAAHSLAALGSARVHHLRGTDAEDDLTYLVRAGPNVIMNNAPFGGFVVAGSHAAAAKSNDPSMRSTANR